MKHNWPGDEEGPPPSGLSCHSSRIGLQSHPLRHSCWRTETSRQNFFFFWYHGEICYIFNKTPTPAIRIEIDAKFQPIDDELTGLQLLPEFESFHFGSEIFNSPPTNNVVILPRNYICLSTQHLIGDIGLFFSPVCVRHVGLFRSEAPTQIGGGRFLDGTHCQ